MTDNYREKAAQARRLAGSIPGDPAAARLLEMAEHFDALAREAELGFTGDIFREPTPQQPEAQQQQQLQEQQPTSEDETDTQ